MSGEDEQDNKTSRRKRSRLFIEWQPLYMGQKSQFIFISGRLQRRAPLDAARRAVACRLTWPVRAREWLSKARWPVAETSRGDIYKGMLLLLLQNYRGKLANARSFASNTRANRARFREAAFRFTFTFTFAFWLSQSSSFGRANEGQKQQEANEKDNDECRT